MRTGPLSWPCFGPVTSQEKIKMQVQIYNLKTEAWRWTHPSDPKDTFDAGKDKVEDAQTHHSVHHRPQSRPKTNTTQRH